MLPESPDLFNDELETDELDQSDEELLPVETYRIDFENNRIIGKITDEVESVMQFIKKVLRTDRYSDVIYDWYYGHELLSLIGTPYEYAQSMIPSIIEDALLVDDRINSVDDFEFEKISNNSMRVSFTVNSIYSIIDYDMEVNI